MASVLMTVPQTPPTQRVRLSATVLMKVDGENAATPADTNGTPVHVNTSGNAQRNVTLVHTNVATSAHMRRGHAAAAT